jgi:hypothetical protein
MSEWTSWGIVIYKPQTAEEILKIEGVVRGRVSDLPIFNGTLDEWCERFHFPFTVHRNGRYIQVGVTGL